MQLRGSYEEKSHVGIETRLCRVCGTEYDTGTLLLDARLQKTLTRHVCTGYGLCPEHQKAKEEGYIFLIEVESDQPRGSPPRTGTYILMKKELAAQLFNCPVAEFNYIFPEAAAILGKLQPGHSGGVAKAALTEAETPPQSDEAIQ